jgi:hypothetical protein
MTNPTIPYIDFGNSIAARNNAYSLQTSLSGFAWKLMNNLQNMVVPDQSNLPNSASTTNPPFYGDPSNSGLPDVALTYVTGDGLFPTATIKFFLSAPSGYYNFSCWFNVTFFDANRITVTANNVPAVTARFDMSNVNQSTMNLFSYSILGTAIPVWLDEVSSAYYNNTNPTS